MIIAVTFSFYACSSNKQASVDPIQNVDNHKKTNESAVSDNEYNDYYVDENTQNDTQNNENPSNSEEQYTNTQKDLAFIAPFVDMVSWIDTGSKYSINGAPNLAQFAKETGQLLYSLGFIQLNQSNPINSDGSPRWGWGGYADMSEKFNDGFQYEGIKASINNLKEMGGDVIVSFGGQLGLAPWTVCQDKKVLMQMYLEVINAYNLSRIDLDIEESNQDAYQNYLNAEALKEVQDATNIKITLTIPISPSGWEQKQIDLINAYLGAGLKIDIINSMTMCYYNYGVYQNEDYADASIRAIENAKEQLKYIYSNFGKTLTDSEAYSLMGATVAIGREVGNPDFTADLTKKVVQNFKEKGLRMMAFWNMERDSMIEKNAGIMGQYDHLTELFKFLEN